MRSEDLPERLRKQLGLEKAHKFSVDKSKLNRTADGVVFASALECRIYRALQRNLEARIVPQPKFELQAKFVNLDGLKRRAIYYVADFLIGAELPQRNEFTDPVPRGALVIDAKGHLTREFMQKRKLFEMRYGRLFVIHSVSELGKVPWKDYGIILKRAIFI